MTPYEVLNACYEAMHSTIITPQNDLGELEHGLARRGRMARAISQSLSPSL